MSKPRHGLLTDLPTAVRSRPWIKGQMAVKPIVTKNGYIGKFIACEFRKQTRIHRRQVQAMVCSPIRSEPWADMSKPRHGFGE